ncbi:hypothetical protein GCM10010168_28190 [Actinoplanes ianthinogenes]|uniref:Uncharacterized protein n=1 Tax=Actinoplanes ianthinogenes TaxID=122358 RepID=A0ABM7LL36_9ACTN|nr:hypothetical protein [Actinoplanes ianthinogenes]BCJ39960.1 hypothetical protein Aiant_06170 [Actinoplanes ianthinogenes]GGR09296.1 hypothetical protein GCM10010168_28190 [Actinoplanes ianthinogenes]
MRSLHNYVLTAAGPAPNPDYVPPADYLAGRNEIALEPPPPVVGLDLRLLDLQDLTTLRTAVLTWAGAHQFAATAARDVVDATTEVATNGLVHGAPPVRVRGWR